MRRIFFDDKAYKELLKLMNNQHFTEKSGVELDMKFLSQDRWLKDTAVVENVARREGMWEIQLVFAHYEKPYKLIKRSISRHTDKKKAELTAQYMRRLAAKDPRGTLEVKIKDFKLCKN